MEKDKTVRTSGMLIIGHTEAEDKELKLKRQIKTLMAICFVHNRDRLDTVKLKSKIVGITGNLDITPEDMLDEFMKLPEEQQVEIIMECTEESNTINLDITAMAGLLKSEKYTYETFDDGLILSDAELRKRIKYCKNPMEKQRLQRELSGVNYASGRHRKGKRKKH